MMKRPGTAIPQRATRRHFLASAAAAPLVLASGASGSSARFPVESDPFTYETERSEAEWREILSEAEYQVLRDRWTELPESSPLWNDYRDGVFGCRGCGLHVYSSTWRAPLDKGWVFFAHAEPTTVLTDIDGPQDGYVDAPEAPQAMLEVHCRRCASHLGHIVLVDGRLLHCINGASLVFSPSEA